jgi:hypothetical protein
MDTLYNTKNTKRKKWFSKNLYPTHVAYLYSVKAEVKGIKLGDDRRITLFHNN